MGRLGDTYTESETTLFFSSQKIFFIYVIVRYLFFIKKTLLPLRKSKGSVSECAGLNVTFRIPRIEYVLVLIYFINNINY